jgi:hypothetical protein
LCNREYVAVPPDGGTCLWCAAKLAAEARAKIAALVIERDGLEAELADEQECRRKVVARAALLEAENARLRALEAMERAYLRRWVEHLPDCPALILDESECECGLRDALAALDREAPDAE